MIKLKCCDKCAQPKSADEFSRVKKYQGQCITCVKKQRSEIAPVEMPLSSPLFERRKRYSHRMDKRLAYRNDRDALIETRAARIFFNAKSRAHKTNRKFDLSVCFIRIHLMLGKCARSGIPFQMGPNRSGGKQNPFAPSIDRIDNARGYENGNIQVVCNMFNMGKSEHDELDFVAMCVAVAKKHQNDPAVIVRLMELGA